MYSPQSRAERLIAAGRVVLAASSLFAIWLDPLEPAKHGTIAYALLGAYLAYSAGIAVLVWRSEALPASQRLVTHAFDLCFFSLFIYFTAGPASPFIAYFVFSLVCATLRWGWQGTLWTAAAALSAFLGVGIYFAEVLHDPAFELRPFIIRGVYLAVMAALLGYLGGHEQRTRREMSLLTSWPEPPPPPSPPPVERLLVHASTILRAPRSVLAWTESEEPWLHLASWEEGSFTWERESPSAFAPLVPSALAEANFLCTDAGGAAPTVIVREAGELRRHRGNPIDPRLARRYGMGAVLALWLPGETFDGRLFFLEKPAMTSDDLVLGEIVAAVVAARLDRYHLTRKLQETAATEERIRLARDLHDGVLQSLTGVGLRLAAVQRLLDDDPAAARERLEELQRLVSLEQRDLRFFIQELKPPAAGPSGQAPDLVDRVAELARRIELEWGLRVRLRSQGLEKTVPEALARDVYLLVREALVNAVRHGEASTVDVEISAGGGGGIALSITDDGKGFPFRGRFTESALAAQNLGPRTLRERVSALGGTLSLDSSERGARLEMFLPLARDRA